MAGNWSSAGSVPRRVVVGPRTVPNLAAVEAEILKNLSEDGQAAMHWDDADVTKFAHAVIAAATQAVPIRPIEKASAESNGLGIGIGCGVKLLLVVWLDLKWIAT